jgi:hypothetical protein
VRCSVLIWLPSCTPFPFVPANVRQPPHKFWGLILRHITLSLLFFLLGHLVPLYFMSATVVNCFLFLMYGEVRASWDCRLPLPPWLRGEVTKARGGVAGGSRALIYIRHSRHKDRHSRGRAFSGWPCFSLSPHPTAAEAAPIITTGGGGAEMMLLRLIRTASR